MVTSLDKFAHRRPKARRRNDSAWRSEVEERRGRLCRRCGTSNDLQCDHVIERSQGGPSVVENGTMLCRTCHDLKTQNRIRYEHAWLDPDQVAWLAAQGWVKWGPDGVARGRACRQFADIPCRNS